MLGCCLSFALRETISHFVSFSVELMRQGPGVSGQQPVKTWCLPGVMCMSLDCKQILPPLSFEMTEALAYTQTAALWTTLSWMPPAKPHSGPWSTKTERICVCCFKLNLGWFVRQQLRTKTGNTNVNTYTLPPPSFDLVLNVLWLNLTNSQMLYINIDLSL